MNVAGAAPVPGTPSDLPAFRGELRWDEDALTAAAEDFGHLLRRRPRAVLRPESGADVAVLLRWASPRGVPVAARGVGHSVYGRAHAENGVVVDMTSLNRVHQVSRDRVVVDAGATWSEVLAATLPHGLTPPVLTDYLDLSVGGTIAAGGIGGASHRYGAQSCSALELDVVTGDGRELTCSAQAHPDLFDAVRAGLSQCAVIIRATVALVPAPERVRRYVLRYPDVRALTADQLRLLAADRVDDLLGTVLADPAGGWRYQAEIAVRWVDGAPPDDAEVLAGLSDDRAALEVADLGYLEYLTRLVPLERRLRDLGRWRDPHPWFTSFVGAGAVADVAESVLADLTPTDLTAADLGPVGRMIVYPFRASRVASPALRLPADDVVFLFNLLRFPPDDAEVVAGMLAANRALHDRVRAAGGVGYPVSAVALEPADWMAHFGPHWPEFQRAKDTYDPAHVLTPGQRVF